jgi:two-component system nitrogen regulation response regulator NtrX
MISFKGLKVLVVDDESSIRKILSASLEDEGFVVESAESGEEAIEKLPTFKPDIMLLDVWMPGEYDGIGVLERLGDLNRAPYVVVMSGHGTIETAVKAVKLGAWDFVEKPISIDKILITLQNMMSFAQKEKERQSLLSQLKESYLLEGSSPHMQSIKSLIMKYGKSSSPYLISGEEGVGKTLVARNIHYMSDRAGGPFVAVNCHSIPEGLHDEEIFSETGKLATADGGTLYLKNIEALEAGAQEKLADYLREKGQNRSYDVRLVGATSEDLKKMSQAREFREDLYVKLSYLAMSVQPLRNRKDDIPILFEAFSFEQSRKVGEPYRPIQDKALDLLISYEWPGNVKELKNFVERLYILSGNDSFDVYDLNYAGLKKTEESVFLGSGDFRAARAEFEKNYLMAKLSEHKGNISKTSEAIGLERSYLHRKIKAYDIEVDGIK